MGLVYIYLHLVDFLYVKCTFDKYTNRLMDPPSRCSQVPSSKSTPTPGPEVRQRLHLELDDAAAAAEITAEASGQIWSYGNVWLVKLVGESFFRKKISQPNFSKYQLLCVCWVDFLLG